MLEAEPETRAIISAVTQPDAFQLARGHAQAPARYGLPTQPGCTQKQATSILSGIWPPRPQDPSCTHRLTALSPLEHHWCCWCLGLTSNVSLQGLSHRPGSAARPHWRRHEEELLRLGSGPCSDPRPGLAAHPSLQSRQLLSGPSSAFLAIASMYASLPASH